MNGQAKVLIPALIGIITLLLTGVTGIRLLPGEQQAIQIAETRAITLEAQNHQTLATAFRDGEFIKIEAQLMCDWVKSQAVETTAARRSIH